MYVLHIHVQNLLELYKYQITVAANYILFYCDHEQLAGLHKVFITVHVCMYEKIFFLDAI